MKMRMIGALALSAAVIAGCKKADETDNKTASPSANEVSIEINGQTLTRGQLDDDINKVLKDQAIPDDQREPAKKHFETQMVQQFIIKNLLLAEAKKANITITDEDRKEREAEFVKANAGNPNAPKSIAEAIEKSPFGAERGRQEYEDGMLIEKFIKQAITDKVTFDPTEVDNIIKRIEDSNAKAKEANAKLDSGDGDAKALEKIKDLKKQLDAGADFAELAKANSDCPSSAKGGSLGKFGKGMMVKEFEEAAFTLEPGKVSDPVKTPFGYHLILVTKKNPAVEAAGDKLAEPETVEASHILVKTPERQREQPVPPREDVEKYVKRQAEDSALRAYINKLVMAADIKTSEEFKMFMPQKPAEEAKPAEEVKPAEEAKPAEAAKPAEEVKPAEEAKPAEAAK